MDFVTWSATEHLIELLRCCDDSGHGWLGGQTGKDPKNTMSIDVSYCWLNCITTHQPEKFGHLGFDSPES